MKETSEMIVKPSGEKPDEFETKVVQELKNLTVTKDKISNRYQTI